MEQGPKEQEYENLLRLVRKVNPKELAQQTREQLDALQPSERRAVEQVRQENDARDNAARAEELEMRLPSTESDVDLRGRMERRTSGKPPVELSQDTQALHEARQEAKDAFEK